MNTCNLPDTVRGLAVMSDLGVLSASHDGYVSIAFLFLQFSISLACNRLLLSTLSS